MRRRLAYAVAILAALAAGCRAAPPPATPAGLPVLSRAEWGAAEPVLPMRSHTPGRITVHHTAIPQAPGRATAEKLRALQRFSQQRNALADGRVKEAWADVPYHFYVAADGTIAEGRPLAYVGDSNTPYDPTGHVQIVLEGDFEHERPTEAQTRSLWELTYRLARRWRIPPGLVQGHGDHAETACPGASLEGWLPRLREHLAGHL